MKTKLMTLPAQTVLLGDCDTTTVWGLINALYRLPDHFAPVISEGGDDFGEVAGIEIDEDGTVVLARHERL